LFILLQTQVLCRLHNIIFIFVFLMPSPCSGNICWYESVHTSLLMNF
jgi:hypothetical protein